MNKNTPNSSGFKITAKKTLGQNFLKDKKIIQRIVDSADIKKGETIVEVGPGKGHMTRAILDAGAKLIVIEKDHRLIPFLEEKFSEEIANNQLTVIQADVMDLVKNSWETLNFVNHDFKIVANLPYYITGKFISTSLQGGIQPEKIVLLLQEEVVSRITGVNVTKDKRITNNRESILSLSVKVYGNPKYEIKVSRKYFSPQPRVDSAVLSISDISKKRFTENNINEEEFFKLVKQGFSSKRKFVLSNLKKGYSDIDVIFEKLNLNKKSRPEDLDLKDWIGILKIITT